MPTVYCGPATEATSRRATVFISKPMFLPSDLPILHDHHRARAVTAMIGRLKIDGGEARAAELILSQRVHGIDNFHGDGD
ncbi:MAG: hypothetical protein A3G34_02175 [Candidatus Lindowbacteria bacterium RIFCSPLOWO2_12_FULL_62_27]|nr:MAG: hypothetical protein A3G34_02175 [Candidatus Lindowbacteria bacterium RIFCSPLOWO2_12_FULL_62_27]OGH61226.1 MAG: hypothetical protein A3I06_15615 [Candidatus Lindowbacteria bacterium RIFCSPLOWO2_02_FULL_62_12]